ncbi:LOW QUALITY PROTEIN: carotenoid 9,10(9',10')-cleavage dioxygenase 1-like [Pistacia vera]|uniref:LOW QUALITY PROTEIN: carotenoid 9,10(9',10')-cleavage dioxygenase 1-like n=1 Tax=Pistacia vera TaxID=55513 RepID=UPI0012632DEC|nr:LOW QUALITY PROTEIN: carotenoid 9,10(9',10')-cleavage dioxygenase 1-like [Pistacia vera]
MATIHVTKSNSRIEVIDRWGVLSIIKYEFGKVLRFGKINKYLSNTNVFEHSGKFYSIAENHIPQEIDIFTLKTYDNWDVNGTWNRPFTSHPKKDPDTEELVIMGIDAAKPFVEVGVISADGNKLVHRMDLKLNRCTLCHEMGVTRRYNVFLDFPLSIDINRLIQGGQLINYEPKGYARIGVMPRYGVADSIQWFVVKPNCTFHIINCFEDGDEVVVLGCRALESVIPGPTLDLNRSERSSEKNRHVESFEESIDTATKEVFSSPYEWRLNMQTGEVKEKNLCGTKFSMDFPMINGDYTGIKNKYGYTQTVDSAASSTSGIPKFGGIAKLYFEEPVTEVSSREKMIKMEYHKLEENVFCTGATFVSKGKGLEEDAGWIISFVHNEDTNISQVYIIDTKKFSSEAVAKITLPCRVPYGFHGAYMPIENPIESFKIFNPS